MRIHGIACGYVLCFALKIKASRIELACLLLAMGMVTAAEALNTSIEKLCDFTESRQDKRIGRIKDMAAGGVVLSALFAALVGFTVFLRPELWQAVLDIAGTPWKLVAFGGSAVLSVVVICLPLKR